MTAFITALKRTELFTRAGILSTPPVTLFILALGAMLPILGDRLPHADDLGSHLLRMAQLDHLVRQGIFFSRWQPDLALGYGYPLFNYMAPLSYYLALPWTLFGLSPAAALQTTFAAGIWLSGMTMFYFMRELVRPAAALVAAIAYMYAPYYAYDVLFRANFGEAMAFFWLPLALLAMRRTARGGGSGWLTLGALSYAAITLTHNVTALLFSPLLATYGLLQLAALPTARVRRLGAIALLLLLGLAIAAFFWAPALLQRDLIQLDLLLAHQDYLYQDNFQSLVDIFALPQLSYRDLINPSPPPSWGLISVLVAVFAWLGYGRMSAEQRRHLILFSLLLVLFLWMLLPQSAFVWERIALLQTLQFPWRIYAVATVVVAASIGLTADLLPNRALPLLGLLLIINAQGWLYPPYGPRHDTTMADIVPWEQATGTLGATAVGEYRPVTVEQLPPQPAGPPIRATAAEVEIVKREPLAIAAIITTAHETTITVNQFAFEGWQAHIDGRRVPLRAGEPHGLIEITVPAGASRLQITFRETGLRLWSDWLSAGAVVITLAIMLHALRRRHKPPQRRSLASPSFVLLGLLALLLPALRPARLQSNGALRSVDTPQNLQFANGMQLLGYSGSLTVAADRPLETTLFWRAARPVDGDYITTLFLQDIQGILWSAKQSAAPRTFRRPIATNAWPSDAYAAERHLVQPLAATPPGRYRLVLTLFERHSLRAVALQGTIDSRVELGEVILEPPQRVVQVQPQHLLTPVELHPGLELVGYGIDRERARPGDPLLLTLFWRRSGPVAWEQMEELQLTLGATSPARYPVSAIRAEQVELWRSQLLMRVPATLPTADHPLRLALCYENVCSAPVALVAVAVDAPQRRYEAPPLDYTVNHRFRDAAILRGLSVAQNDDQMTVTLAWQALRQMSVSYRVFVHLLDADGTVVAQSDAEPAAWTRPTTGWLAHEIVVDTHVLPKLAGSALRIGLYQADTGERVGEAATLELP